MILNGEVYVKTGRAAELLKVSSGTITAWIDEGLLVAFQPRPGAHRWILKRSIEALLEDWMEQAKVRRSLAASAR